MARRCGFIVIDWSTELAYCAHCRKGVRVRSGERQDFSWANTSYQVDAAYKRVSERIHRCHEFIQPYNVFEHIGEIVVQSSSDGWIVFDRAENKALSRGYESKGLAYGRRDQIRREMMNKEREARRHVSGKDDVLHGPSSAETGRL